MTLAALSGLPDPARSRALLIGFAKYRHEPPLPAVTNNLDALEEFFTSPAGWGLPTKHCQVIRNATVADDLIGPLCSNAAAARDTLFVYYAGHGILDEDMEFSLSLPDAQLDKPWTGVSYKWVRRYVAQARAQRRVVILDSCFSGKAQTAMGSSSEAVRVQAATNGTVVITSARDDRVALAPVGEPYTAFTGELLNVLHKGIDGEPAIITVNQIYECVKQALTSKGRPRPDRTGSDTAGNTLMAVNRAFVQAERRSEPAVPARRYLRALVTRLQQAHDDRTDVEPASQVAVTSATTATEGPLRGRTAGHRPTAEQDSHLPGGVSLAGGRYETTAVVGAGGMGEVHLGRDTLLGRTVAIKRLHPRLSGGAADHLREEARAVATLNHPSIATVYDVVQEATGPYMIMEYVRGWNLWDFTLLRSTRPTVQESLAMVLDILDGLEHSHTAGIIHCDIKPANLILTPEGRVKILDFGISSLNESLHRDGSTSGTLAYMPPESRSGATPHVTRDIFGTGAVLYELVTGQCIPKGSLKWPRPSEDMPGLTSGVKALIEKATALSPDERYSTAAQMHVEVERHL
ncbi:protein kinase [Streptomyces sp. NPDC087525]|uniref:caspase, EACC1-associated type n=1 Tax=Streptomyces sp. NPDC087525 TaxID=3365793 RepID=UPI003827CD9C